MEIERREDADADDGDGEPLVATVDATEGIPTRRARPRAQALVPRMVRASAGVGAGVDVQPHRADPPDASTWGSPRASGTTTPLTTTAAGGAYPSERTRQDPVVAKYAELSMRGQRSPGRWWWRGRRFLLGGERVVGETLWNRWSITALPPLA